jgi:hypothetical protein
MLSLNQTRLWQKLHCKFVIHTCRVLPFLFSKCVKGGGGGAVVKALRYKLEGRVFDSGWCH